MAFTKTGAAAASATAAEDIAPPSLDIGLMCCAMKNNNGFPPSISGARRTLVRSCPWAFGFPAHWLSGVCPRRTVVFRLVGSPQSALSASRYTWLTCGLLATRPIEDRRHAPGPPSSHYRLPQKTAVRAAPVPVWRLTGRRGRSPEVVQADGGFPPIRGSPLINCGRPLPWLTSLPAMAPVACTGIAIPPSYAPPELSYALTPWSGSTAIPLCGFPGRMP